MFMYGIICTGIKFAAFIVLDFHRASGHNLVKDKVNGGQNLPAAAEILFHGNEQIVVFFSRRFRKAVVFRLKKIGVGQTEAINTLLYIPNRKAVIVPRNQIEDCFLYAIGVLIFIDHNGLVLFPQGKGCICRRKLRMLRST